MAARKPRKYFTLVQQDTDGVWSIQFGDYDRSCVEFELDEIHYQGAPKKTLRILTTANDQPSINAAVAKINSVAL